MSIFNLLTLIGGLALFLFGMNIMGDGLVMLSGGKLEKILEKLTNKRIMAVLLGTLVTAVIQSSSATTVMVVGFVNSGIMRLGQAVGVIMGANIGTTITSWILSLTGIQGSNLFLKLLKPSSFAPILAGIGIVLTMTQKEGTRKRTIGTILLGFAVLMQGMETMSGAVAPLANEPAFTSLLIAFSNPILGMLAGALLTAIIQSSSASVGILQALCITGAVSYGVALPIIMGQNIGTCVTALLSSIGASKNAKRASIIHLYFNLIGTALFMTVFYSIHFLVPFKFLQFTANAAGIAVIHSLFNIGCAIVLFPFCDQLVKLATLTIPDSIQDRGTEPRMPAVLIALDDRFLDRPAFAMQLCKNAVDEMAEISRDAFNLAMETLYDYSEEKAAEVIRQEQLVDNFEDRLGTYLVKLSGRDLTKQDSQLLSILLHAINDFERISDHAINVVESAQKMRAAGLTLSERGQKELYAFSGAIHDILDLTADVFLSMDVKKARHVEPLEEVIDSLSLEMKQRHIERLRAGSCRIETGLILEDIVTNYERVSDHCSNVAVCLIEISADAFSTHAYLEEAARGADAWFQQEYRKQKLVYQLP